MTSKPNTKPKIDRSAEDAQEVPLATTLPPQPPADLMPTVENAPPCFFTPGAGIGTSDVLEITLMYLLQLTGSRVQVEKGALRALPLDARRLEELSDSARRFMQPAPTPAN